MAKKNPYAGPYKNKFEKINLAPLKLHYTAARKYIKGVKQIGKAGEKYVVKPLAEAGTEMVRGWGSNFSKQRAFLRRVLKRGRNLEKSKRAAKKAVRGAVGAAAMGTTREASTEAMQNIIKRRLKKK